MAGTRNDTAHPVAVHDLSLAYGPRAVLRNVCLSVKPGELVGLLGPNGAGKSSLVKVLSGVLRGYGGSARIDDREVASMGPKEIATRVAVVPQEPIFSLHFTVLDVVLMGRHPHAKGLGFESRDDLHIARAALRRCGAEALADRCIHDLSAGERQRVVFARAVAQQTRVLLLDEPASFLDIRHQVALYDSVRQRVDEQRIAVLTVLHDLNLAAEYCHRIYLLRDGQIAAEGPTEQVFTYANLTRVFDTEIYVDTNALTGRLLVAPMSARMRRSVDAQTR